MWRSSRGFRRLSSIVRALSLAELEKADGRPKPADLAGDLPLFQAAAAPRPEDSPSKLKEALRSYSPDGMTPKEAIEALYRLKALLEDEA